MYIRDFRLQNIQQWTGNYFWIVYDLSKWLHGQQDCSHESSSLPGSCYATSFLFLLFPSHLQCLWSGVLVPWVLDTFTSLCADERRTADGSFLLRKHVICSFTEGIQHRSNFLQIFTWVIQSLYREKETTLFVIAIWLHVTILPGEHIHLKWLKFIYIYKHIHMLVYVYYTYTCTLFYHIYVIHTLPWTWK